MQRFTLPRDLYHGKGALEALKNFEGKRAMICVGGGSMKRFGFLDKAEAYLKEAGMEVELFEGIEPDPSVETVMKGAAAMEKFKPDWIVAIGGGSPIDAAKAMWIKYEYPDITFEDMCKVFGIPKLRKKAHFCAISSTSGTATEVTAFSIITDYEKGIKYPIADFEIINRELENFSEELAERPQIVAANKSDMATPEQISAFRSYIENLGYPFFEISAATTAGTKDLIAAASHKLEELPPIKRYEPEPLSLEELENNDRRKFDITVDEEGVYVIDAPWLEQALSTVDMDDYESLQYFQRVMRSSGIIDKLEEMGIQEGDTVELFGFQFDFIN